MVKFTEVKPLRYWVQHILPLVYDDSLSYMELLGRVVNTLNEVVKNNNLLPDYIAENIKEYISSGEIEKVLAEVLANYMLNVKFPPAGLTPATGDGSADDTEAIQGCIDYAYNHGGMSVYFPSGSYLTQPLTLRDKATLFGQDRYTTRLIMKGGSTKAMFTGDVDELTLTGLGFDGNMDIQVNNVNLFTISVNSAIITNCLLTDGYDLLNITVNNDLQLNNVIFKHAVENALVLNGDGFVQGDNLIFKTISALVGKNFVVVNVSNSILEQLKCHGASPNAVLINGNNNVVKMWNDQSTKAYTDNGTNNTIVVYTQSEQKKLTGFKTTNVSGDISETVGGDKTETITGDKGVSAKNLTETTAGNCTRTVTGDINENAKNLKAVIQLAYDLTANTLTEHLTGKEVNATNLTEKLGNKTETITGDKQVSAANSIETIQGNKTVTAGDISETSVNKTVHITKDNTEQIDGTSTISVGGIRTETYNGDKTEKVTGLLTKILEGFKFIHSGGTITNKKRQNAAVIHFPDSLAGPLVNFGRKCDFLRFSSSLKYSVVNFIGTWTSGTIAVTQHSNDESCSQLVFSKTRSTENADIPVAISPHDDLGEIRFAGATNTDFKDGGWITGRVPADAVINEDITKIPTQFGFGVSDSHVDKCVCIMRPYETDFTDRTGFGMDSLEGGGEIAKTPDGYYSAFFNRPICIGFPGEILYNARWLNDGYYSIVAGSCFRILQSGNDLHIISNLASKPNEKIQFELEHSTAVFPVTGLVRLPRLNNADGSYVITSDSDGTLHRTSINRLRELLNGV